MNLKRKPQSAKQL